MLIIVVKILVSFPNDMDIIQKRTDLVSNRVKSLKFKQIKKSYFKDTPTICFFGFLNYPYSHGYVAFLTPRNSNATGISRNSNQSKIIA